MEGFHAHPRANLSGGRRAFPPPARRCFRLDGMSGQAILESRSDAWKCQIRQIGPRRTTGSQQQRLTVATHPYSDRPDYCYWRRAHRVAAIDEIDPFIKAPFKIGQEDLVATAGSCFAQHIAERLRKDGFSFMVTEIPHPLISGVICASVQLWCIFSALRQYLHGPSAPAASEARLWGVPSGRRSMGRGQWASPRSVPADDPAGRVLLRRRTA